MNSPSLPPVQVSRPGFLAVSFVLLLGLIQPGCTTLKTARADGLEHLISQARPGDTVEGTRRNGTEFSFVVTQVEKDALVGESRRVARADIRELKLTRFSPGRTTLAVIGVVGLGLALASVASLGALGFPPLSYP